MGFDIYIFDHHSTNMWAMEIEGIKGIMIATTPMGVKECGTSLFYKYAMENNEGHEYFNEKMNEDLLPEFVETVRQYDTYDWKMTNNMQARYLQIIFGMLGIDIFYDRYIKKLTNPDDKVLIEKSDMDFVLGRIRMEQRNIEKCTPDKVMDVNINGRNIALMIGSQGANFSELSNQFLKKYPQYDGTVDFYLSGNGANFQIRGKGDIDLAYEIARPIGGGGHPAACGAPLSDEYHKKLKNLVLEALTNKRDIL